MENSDLSDDIIYIMNLTSQIENLSKEKEKNDFVKNYAKIKKQIEKTDNILENIHNNNDTKTCLDNQIVLSNFYDSYSIQELFDILESNSEFISNPDKLDVSTFKMLLNISSILEEKLNTESMNIIESK